MKYRIIVVDDNEAYSNAILQYIKRIGEETHRIFETTVYKGGQDLVDNYVLSDIIFLDIKMKCLNGMEAAKKIRELDNQVIIIFVSDTSQYAIDGYSVGAFDYLLKPIDYSVLKDQLGRCIEKIKLSSERYFSCKTVDEGLVRLPVQSILYIESFDHNMSFYTTSKEYRVATSLRNLEDALPKGYFFRCHKSYIVNLAQIASVKGTDLVIANKTIPIARDKKKRFMNALTNFNI